MAKERKVTRMDPFTKKRFEVLLQNTRENLIRSLESLRDPEDDQGSHGEPMDEADVALLEHQRQTLHRMRSRYRALFWEVENALKRLRNGEYGLCDRCGDPIQPDRLAVQPTARLCIDCQRMLEKTQHFHQQHSRASHGPLATLEAWPVDSTVAGQWRYPECLG